MTGEDKCNRIRIAVCDDEPEAVRCITGHIIRQGNDDMITVYDTPDRMDPDELCGYDLVFMDIDMGRSNRISVIEINTEGSIGIPSVTDGADKKANGIELARLIRVRQESLYGTGFGSLPLIVFITGYREYMPDAFGVYAFDYLIKPVSDASFDKTYRRAGDLISKLSNPGDILTIRTLGEVYTVRISDITYVESISRKNILHLADDSSIEYYGSLSELEYELPASFFRIHKGYIVNMDHITMYDRTSVTVSGGDRPMMSKYRFPEFTAAYMDHINKRGRGI